MEPDLIVEFHSVVRARLSRDCLGGLLPWNVRVVVLLEGIEGALVHDSTLIRGVWPERSLTHARSALSELPQSVTRKGVWYLQAPGSCLPSSWDSLGNWVNKLYQWAERV